MNYVGFWGRGIAFIIDAVIISACLGFIAYALSQFGVYDRASAIQSEKDTPAAVYHSEERYAGGSLKRREEITVNTVSFDLPGQLPAEDVLYAVIFALYFSLFHASILKATPGKRAFSAQVVRLNGSRLSYAQAFCRLVLTVILPFGIVTIPFSTRRQALHDMIIGTVVVRQDAGVAQQPERIQGF